jgi:hypothetical protein
MVKRANRPEKNNRKLYKPATTAFIPDPQQVFDEVEEIRGPVEFLHPITGKSVVYRRRRHNAG